MKNILFILALSIIFCGIADTQTKTKSKKTLTNRDTSIVNRISPITFIELGSVRCIPCKMMQPVMKNITEKYGEQVKVVFYDVWTPEQQHYAQHYRIRVIPTQVFLDEKGSEFHRHEGYYPEGEIDKLLQSKGLKPRK